MPGPSLAALIDDLHACRICRDEPRYGAPLPHEPRPVIQASATARLCIAGQAPGTRVHASGKPFTDPSGNRLRDWLGIDGEAFYDSARVSIVPMGHCFPGLDAKGGDRPPRRECAETWRKPVFAALPNIELILLIGQYAQRWHLRSELGPNLSETMSRWRTILDVPRRPRLLPLPHPSWRNNAWLRRNPWFESELLPVLRTEVAGILA